MASKTVNALNTLSGRVAQVPASYLDSPDFGPYLIEVPEGTKDYDPEFFKAGTAEEHKAKPVQKRKASKVNQEDGLNIDDANVQNDPGF